MITAQLQGGLGNQLFQIAAASAAGSRSQVPVAFDFDEHVAYTQGNLPSSYRYNLLSRVAVQSIKRGLPRFIEPSDRLLLPPVCSSLLLQGFFCCLDYFEDKQDLVKDLFQLDLGLIKQLRIKYDLNNQLNCHVHVRRGDYLYAR